MKPDLFGGELGCVHIESVNDHGQTPLFCAAWGGDVEVVQLLLSLGANPNRRCGSSGATPVHAATYRGSRRVLRLLIEAGADLSVRDSADLTPRDYADRQPHPLRRQKILAFLDLILAMTLHRGRGLDPHNMSGHNQESELPSTPANTLSRRPLPGFSHSSAESKLSLNKSTLSLSKKSLGSVTSVWAACVGVSDLPRDRPNNSTLRPKPKVLTPVQPTPSVANLNKSVSCHLLDQLCVTTSLPLLSPDHLQRPTVPSTAYTCGGPTVYSPYSWLGTPVTVRRPTPALTISKDNKGNSKGGKPDQDAVLSLLEELAILRRLRHPAFLEVMAACHVTDPAPDHVTLVFQHVPHGSLYHHLHVMHRDLSVAGAVDMLVGVVEGLLFLHAHGWLHSGLSSHALHLVSTSHAKLGSFQHAIQQQAKGGCSMKADELSRASWLVPWQAPEVISEAMVSVKSEVYAFAAIIWEIWAGMPPWCGIPESEVKQRIGDGKSLPFLTGAPPSLVMYLTQYGLKWNAHERDLDFHEIHTMLRSLRVQVEEDERVPTVTAWGPPSVPNTPIVGRGNLQDPTLTLSSHKSDILRKQSSLTSADNIRPSSASYPSTSARSSSEIHPSQYLQFVTIDQSTLSSSSSCSSVHTQAQQVPDSQQRSSKRGSNSALQLKGVNSLQSSSSKLPLGANSNQRCSLEHQLSAVQVHESPSKESFGERWQNKHENTSVSSCPRSATKVPPEKMTSTPIRSGGGRLSDLPPDLLPSKFRPVPHMQPGTPDILSRELGSLLRPFSDWPAKSPVPEKENEDASNDNAPEFAYIVNKAKRAFFSESEESSKAPSPVNDKSQRTCEHKPSIDGPKASSSQISVEREIASGRLSVGKESSNFEAQDVKGSIRTDVVRRGLSLSNLLNIGGASMVTRTFSHVSLCSAESAGSSSGTEARKPQRTISQVTLTFKKLSTADSSSSSSRDELEEANKGDPSSGAESAQRYRRSKSLPKSPHNSKSPRNWEEVTGIKPASHQLTRHSSSCSLSSGGPPSPVHQFVGGPGHSLLAAAAVKSRHGSSLPTSPQYNTHRSIGSRPTSSYGSGGVSDAHSVKVNPRHYSESSRRNRRLQKKPDIEPEEEFIDDEFNASLFEQPHMQLSVGSSENLLDNNRLSATSMMADDNDFFPGSLQLRRAIESSSCVDLQSSITAYDSTFYNSRLTPARQVLNALPENSDEDLSLTLRDSGYTQGEPEDKLQEGSHQLDAGSSGGSKSPASEAEVSDSAEGANLLSCPGKDSDSVVSSSPALSEFRKEYEPLQSVLLLRNMHGKGLSLYLPKHSVGSDDSEVEVL
ncbi:Serine-threonine/tyrosine-protein kinase catalytic domain [Trinorchestia longiramus]|nr:Serine-threonine/tyrosine-protein kinase catalytic domain [Trinorchestia longiramus]